MSFKALILEKDEVNGFSHSLKTLTKQQLLQQQGDTLVQIQYSSINYLLTRRSVYNFLDRPSINNDYIS